MYHLIEDSENIIYTIPTHTVTGELYVKVISTIHREAVGGGMVRIQLRSELYTYEAVCAHTLSKIPNATGDIFDISQK